jgi:AbrB family looped-hinge helix DNA binding protein
MKTVRISPKFQVVIPQSVREAMKLSPGTAIQVFQYENRIEFIPQRRLKKMRGFLKGIDTRVPRERDRV